MSILDLPFGLASASLLRIEPLATIGPQGPSFTSIFFYSGTAVGGIDWIGSGIIWLLIALSIANVGLIVRAWTIHRVAAIAPRGLAERARAQLLAGRRREAGECLRGEESDLATMLLALLDAESGGEVAMANAVGDAADAAHARRMRSIEPLSAVGQVSPMIGLFGTVYGMIVAFQTIAASGGAADPVLLAGGIGTALVTTFWGLLVAIPALAAYATLRGRIDSALADAERDADEIAVLLRSKRDPA
jgi:biopolymer transport protein ExbB